MLFRLDEIVSRCQRLARQAFDPYRPEQHHMRGPGPKWHTRHRAEGAAR